MIVFDHLYCCYDIYEHSNFDFVGNILYSIAYYGEKMKEKNETRRIMSPRCLYKNTIQSWGIIEKSKTNEQQRNEFTI